MEPQLKPHQRLIEHPDRLVSVAGVCQVTGQAYESPKMTPGYYDDVMKAPHIDAAPYTLDYRHWVLIRHGVILPERYDSAPQAA